MRQTAFRCVLTNSEVLRHGHDMLHNALSWHVLMLANNANIIINSRAVVAACAREHCQVSNAILLRSRNRPMINLAPGSRR